MYCIENIEMSFGIFKNEQLNREHVIFYSPRLNELFPHWPKERANIHNDWQRTYIKNVYDTSKTSLIYDELYILHEFDESVYGHGIFNLIKRLPFYPKDKKILCTNFSDYIIELYEYLIKDGYNFYSFGECKNLIVNKKILIKKLYFYEERTVEMPFWWKFENKNYSSIQKLIKKENIVFFREDAEFGQYRKLTNLSEVKEIFLKYGFIIKTGFNNLSLYEKKLYMNGFKNIFIETGGGTANSFLVDSNSNITIYNLVSPTWNAVYFLDATDVKYKTVDIGYVDIYSPSYNVYFKQCGDPSNEPWKIDLNKLEDLLKTLTNNTCEN